MKKISYNNIYIFLLLTLLLLYSFNSYTVINGVLNYTKLFLTKLFPASFIFYIFSSLLLDYNLPSKITKSLHINGNVLYVLIMSIISGFPSGSKYIKDLYIRNQISLETANYLLLFTHYPNPIFILGPVSDLFTSEYYSFCMLISLILSNFIIGFVFKNQSGSNIPSDYNYINTSSFSINLSKAVFNSIKTIILIYGISLFFYLIILVINQYIKLNPYLYVFISGFFDLTYGVFSSSILSSDFIKSIFIMFFVSLGGISVNMQVKSIISDTLISYEYFLLGRILQFIISVILFILVIHWMNYFY